MTKDILGCERTRIPTRSEQRRLRKLIKRYRKEWARAAYVRLQKEQGAKPAGDYGPRRTLLRVTQHGRALYFDYRTVGHRQASTEGQYLRAEVAHATMLRAFRAGFDFTPGWYDCSGECPVRVNYDTFAKAAYRANQCHAKDSVKP